MARNKRGWMDHTKLPWSAARNAPFESSSVEASESRGAGPPKRVLSSTALVAKRAYRVVPLIFSALVCLASNLTHAATFTVTQPGNTGPGSLPVIINTANATPGNHIIEFSITGTIAMTGPLPVITNSLTINGRSNIVISGSGVTRLFTFDAGTTNVLSALTMRDALTTGNGGAISNAGTLLISACILTNNQAANGGAIANGGLLTLVDATLVNNRATAQGTGGGVWNSGAATIYTSLVALNDAGNGGGVFNQGLLALSSSTLSNNLATLGFGGGIYCLSNSTLNGCALIANRAQGGNGKGARDKTGGGGGGAGLGGGFFGANSVVAITNSTLSGNSATGGAGGDLNGPGYADGGGNQGGSGSAGGFGGGGSGGYSSALPAKDGGLGAGGGGGVGGAAAYGSPGNGGTGGFGGAAGAVGTLGATYLVSGFGGGGGGGAGIGGAIFLQSGVLTVANCTVASNSVTGGRGGVAPSSAANGQGIGGGIFNLSGTVGLLNTIVAGSTAGSSGPDLFGNFVSAGFNLIGSSQGATNLSVNDYQNVSASLGPLQDNGGPTLTHSLLGGSLAIDGGNNTGAPGADQRGFGRPRGLFVDIGAFEYLAASPPSIAIQPQSQSFVIGANITLSVAASGTGPFTYQWQLNGTNLLGSTSPSLSLQNLSVTNAGRYTVMVANGGGALTSSGADVSFFGDLKFIAAAVLAGPVSAQYRVDYADVLGGITNWLTLTNVTLPFSPFLVIDPASPGRSNRYYRAVQVP